MNKVLMHAAALLLLTTSACTPKASDLPWIPFEWQSEKINGKTIEKTSISLPLTIGELPYRFEAQFDLGAATTMLYGNTFAPYLVRHKQLMQHADSSRTANIQGESCPVLSGLSIRLGEIAFPDADIALFNGYGDRMTADSIDSGTVKHIGTVAADMFNKGVLVIDYPNQRLCSLSEVPADWNDGFEFTDIEYIDEMNWIFLPLNIGGTTRKVLFDTGSSMFPLLSSPTNIAGIADTRQCADSLSVGAWGNQVTVHGYTPSAAVSMGRIDFESLPVYASPYLADEVLQEAGFWAIVGNSYFLDKTIIIDYPNKRFGISL